MIPAVRHSTSVTRPDDSQEKRPANSLAKRRMSRDMVVFPTPLYPVRMSFVYVCTGKFLHCGNDWNMQF